MQELMRMHFSSTFNVKNTIPHSHALVPPSYRAYLHRVTRAPIFHDAASSRCFYPTDAKSLQNVSGEGRR